MHESQMIQMTASRPEFPGCDRNSIQFCVDIFINLSRTETLFHFNTVVT